MSHLSLKHLKKMKFAANEKGGEKKLKTAGRDMDEEGEEQPQMEEETLHAGSKRANTHELDEKDIMNEENDLEFEDEYDDEWEDEAQEPEESDHSSDYEEIPQEQKPLVPERGSVQQPAQGMVVKKEKPKKKDKVVPFIGTDKNMSPEEVLEFENRAYDMLHRATTEYPCLSCDFLTGQKADFKIFKPPTGLAGNEETAYPLDLYGVAGTQASLPNRNALYVMRFSNLCQTKYDDDSDPEEDDEKDEIADGNPIILQRSIPIKGDINRVRSMMGYPIVAVWTAAAQVKIYNVQSALEQLQEVDITKLDGSKTKGLVTEESTLVANFKMNTEGYGLEWSPLKVGRLLAGSEDGRIHVFESNDELCSKFAKLSHFWNYHEGSVEDLQFSPKEVDVFASCGTDGTVQVVDMRASSYKKAQICIKAHECDVNVISWNGLTTNLLASGADDGAIKVWDLRFPAEPPITNIKWHQEAITSIHWQPSDEWTLVAASADHRVSLWDFSVENNEQEMNEDLGVPEQVIFLHHGQEDVKEVRWHPRYKGVMLTTALSGFNVFKPAVNEDAPSEINSEDENELEIIPTL